MEGFVLEKSELVVYNTQAEIELVDHSHILVLSMYSAFLGERGTLNVKCTRY